MTYYLNGEPIQLSDLATVSHLPDRLVVRTKHGSFTGLAVRSGDHILISYQGFQYQLTTKRPRTGAAGTVASGDYRAPMPGQIVDLLVVEGDFVTKGQKVLVLEAMKTQQPFLAPFDGTVSKLSAVIGAQVKANELLAVIQPSAEKE